MEIVARALAEDVGDGDVTTAATVPRGCPRAGADHAEGPGRDLRPRRRRGRRSGRSTRRRRSSGWSPRACGERAARCCASRARRAAMLTGRAHGAELPGAAVRRGDADRALRAGGRGDRRADPRHAQDDARGCATLEKAAVAAGGGTNHRAGLYDAILIKENHAALAGGVGPAVRAAAAYAPGLRARGRVPHARRGRRGARGRARRGSCSTT